MLCPSPRSSLSFDYSRSATGQSCPPPCPGPVHFNGVAKLAKRLMLSKTKEYMEINDINDMEINDINDMEKNDIKRLNRNFLFFIINI